MMQHTIRAGTAGWGVSIIIVFVLAMALSSASAQTGAATATPDMSSEGMIAREQAIAGVSTNAAWTPYSEAFGGVVMVLVPAGEFTIGANPEASDEANGNLIRFDQPFWIDQTEVTQADFARLGGVKGFASLFEGEQRPVEAITWFEAQDFCALRGGRLPTEAEWEYAARGPDGLPYPWGDEFDEERLVFRDNADFQTAEVISRPEGASWVGAHDMLGNVSQWTSSLYQRYPYRADDGRETDNAERPDVLRAVRGGSWFNRMAVLRAGARFSSPANDLSEFIGFRCVKIF